MQIDQQALNDMGEKIRIGAKLEKRRIDNPNSRPHRILSTDNGEVSDARTTTHTGGPNTMANRSKAERDILYYCCRDTFRNCDTRR